MRGILIAGAIAFFLSFTLTPVFIKYLSQRGFGQQIREDGPKTHLVKHGTPTMGGVVLIFSAVAGYLISHLITEVPISISAILVFSLVIALGLIGFLDDWLKVFKQRSLGFELERNSLGKRWLLEFLAIWPQDSQMK